MRHTIIAAAAICMAITGSALAQAPQAGDTGASPDIMNDSATMGAFYTDDTMQTLRPVEEIRTAYMALPEAEREALKIQCEQEATRGTEATALCSHIQTF